LKLLASSSERFLRALMLGLLDLQGGPLAFSLLDPVGLLLSVAASVVVSFRADDPAGLLCFLKAGSEVPQFLQNLSLVLDSSSTADTSTVYL